jgi:glycerate 2-kinase
MQPMNHPGQSSADAREILAQALTAVEPEAAVRNNLVVNGASIRAGQFEWRRPGNGRVLLLGAGKAAGPMARTAESLLAAFAPHGLVVTKYGHSVPLCNIDLIEAGHPLPDENGQRAAEILLEQARNAGAGDLVICLISGGGSALLPAPVAGVTLADKLRATDLLLRAGADIHELNTLRKHLSRIKGGGLARAAAPATLLTLAISDVIGNQPDVIASGPTVPDPTTFADAMAVVKHYGLETVMPDSVWRYLELGAATPELETWKTAGGTAGSHYQVIASIDQAARAASAAANNRGYRSEILSTTQSGEARDVAVELAAVARQRQRQLGTTGQPVCLITGGETTVNVKGNGLGGRNQELALAAALALAGSRGITLLAAGTDGTDGPTDAAGAIVDGETLTRGEIMGLSATDHLNNNDSYHYLQQLNALVMTGPTRTNVMDLTLLLIHPQPAA